MSSKQKYVLTQRHQLIDLNKTFKNFKLQFQVLATEPNKDFHALVLNQEQLDQTDLNTVEMKMAKGRIGGTITADTDKYQNYFLVLRSIQPEDNVEVEVITQLEEIEPQKVTAPVDTLQESSPSGASTAPTPESVSGQQQLVGWKRWIRSPWLWALVLGAILLGGYYYYFYVYKVSHPASIPSIPPKVLEAVGSTTPVVTVDAVNASTTTMAEDVETSSTAPRKRQSSKKELYNKLSQIA